MPKRQTKAAARFTPMDTIPILLTAVELKFLMQALRDVPLTGKPDLLQQILPIVQGLRLKTASAAAVMGRAQQATAKQAEPPKD